jgi:lysophospholipase L1-like esterase
MAVNKVVYNTENGAETLIDLTRDTVTPETLAKGVTAHDASGNVITGTMPTGNKWAGKIASFLGDSITKGMNTDKTYHEYLKELVGFSVCNNYGISGSSVSNYYEAMYSRVSNIDAQSDIVFVFGGTNDFNLNVPMGEWYTLDGTTRTVNQDKSTFRGALAVLCEALVNRFPNKKNVLLTPLHRHTYPGDYTELEANSQGLYLEDYVNAIKEAGKIYSIPVLDLYSESGLFPRNAANAAIYFHANDKLHPNAAGHRVIADVIMGFLDRTYPMYGEPTLPSYTNLVPSAEERIISGDALTEYDGVGYANNYRLSSSGVTKSFGNAITTGFIPASAGDTIRIGGIQWGSNASSANYVCAYKSDYSLIGAVAGYDGIVYGTKIHQTLNYDLDAPLTIITLVNNSDIAFIRVSCYNETQQDGNKLIITKNEEIT